MKFNIAILIISLSVFTFADSMDIKTGEGHRAKTTSVQGTFNSKYESQFPFVCYDKRVKVVVDREMFLTYKGCKRYDASCKRLGRAHFGKYENDYKASKALTRCLTANPKFLD